MKIKALFFLIFPLILLISCADKNTLDHVTEISNPFPENSMFPNLFSQGNTHYLSYLYSQGDTLDKLYFSTYNVSSFSEPQMIAQGKDWFVNWADIPAISVSEDNILASWLDKSSEGTYDYNVTMKLSNDNGSSWGESFIPHKDSISAEHGFVSMDVDDEGNFHTIWLDGRNTKLKDENGKEAYGQMTLRSAIIAPDGSMKHELEIDDRVCDCCQTAVKVTDLGTFAIYRDRSEDEIRDNYFSLFDGKEWSAPKAIHNDNWKISGCPVNGPVMDANENLVVASWYTEASGNAEIYLAKYNSSSSLFDEPVLVSNNEVLGRSDLLITNDNQIVIVWLHKIKDNKSQISAKIYNSDLDVVQELMLGITSAARSSGFPKIVELDGALLLSYTITEPSIKLITKKVFL